MGKAYCEAVVGERVLVEAMMARVRPHGVEREPILVGMVIAWARCGATLSGSTLR